MNPLPIYLDAQASTPLAPEARAAMEPWLGPAGCANPHSAHAMGRAAAAAVAAAREQVARLLPPGGQVVFTGSATEALNLAILGCGARRIAVSAIEHAAVLDTAQCAANRTGGALQRLAVDRDGLVNPETMIAPDTELVAVMQVNNEIGTIQPVEAVAARAHAAGALVLCDAVQGAGKLPPPAGADLIALSAHKLHGPKGIGALWVRDGVSLAPLIHGGGQEGGLRSGTLSPALCAGFGAAAALADARAAADAAHCRALSAAVRGVLEDWTLNGSAERRWPGNLNLSLAGIDVGRLLSECRSVAFSAGSACASGSGRPSHVLAALGLDPTLARASIRLGFSRMTSMDEAIAGAERIAAAARAQLG